MDAKPSVFIRLDIQRICLVCVRKGSCRDDSVAFTDVFWPCGIALHATILCSKERNQKLVFVGNALNRESSFEVAGGANTLLDPDSHLGHVWDDAGQMKSACCGVEA